MEIQEFDQFARESVGASTRRTLVRGLAAILGAAGVGLGSGLVADAGKSKKKKKQQQKKKEKQKEKKQECNAKKACAASTNPCKTVACESNKCVTSNAVNGTSCGNGLECDAGQCICPNGVCILKVTPAEMGGWKFYDDTADQPAATTMEAGPGTPPFGVGSALLEVPEGQDLLISAHVFNGVPLADIETLEYSVYVTSTVGGVAPSLQLGIDFDPDDDKSGWQGRMVYVPNATGPIATGSWQTFSVTGTSKNWFLTNATASGGKCRQVDPRCSFDEILELFPKIRIHPQGPDEKAGAGWGFIGMKVGTDVAQSANVDGLRIKLKGSGTTTIYNFDPNS